MRRTPFPLVLIALLVVAACAPVGSRELHEIVLVGDDGAQRLGYLYGSADAVTVDGASRSLGPLVGAEAEAEAERAPFAVAAARTVDGEPFLSSRPDATLAAPLSVARIPLTTDLRVVTTAAVERAYYFDGSAWFELGRDLGAGRTVDVAPRPVSTPLRGAGALTPAEADAIASALAADGRPLVAAVLPEDDDSLEVPEGLAASPPDGLDEYRHTVIWLQRGVVTDADAYRPPERRNVFEVVARGDQGTDPGRDRFVLLGDRDALRSFWNEVHAASFDPPPLPSADFDRETLLGIRLAERPSGGYGVEIAEVAREGDELFVDVRLSEPAPDAVVTTALTTPWALVRVLGVDASVAWFRDPDDGALFAVARDDAAPF